MRNIIVADHSAEWINMFEEEKKELEIIFGEELLDVHHIGSTAVPGLKAKPVIDIMPEVKNINNVNAYKDKLMAFGYEALGENGICGRRYFRKGGEERSHHLHVFERGDFHLTRHLAFRDYLRNHKGIAFHYGELKQKLADEFSNDIDEYMNGKDQFVKETEKVALEWYEKIN